MHRSFVRCTQLCGLGIVLMVPVVRASGDVVWRNAGDVTAREVAASNQKVSMAYGALVTIWAANFEQLGVRFETPSLARYRGDTPTACGMMPANNAMYCPALNAIYYDDVFVARQANAAAERLGTDGDMAAVGIIAHEMGHAVQTQLGQASTIPYENEAAADCLAGVFTKESATNGNLEAGDLDEVFFGLAAAGDPTPQSTGNRRIDSQVVMRARYLGHGTRQQRLANFLTGYRSGAEGCLAVFR